ncbi:MAG: hypothetical protein IT372_41445 [Polyangiaceae bacterium]|nr:hypothetical protein [Polyangiaceae bacterium]
MLSNPIMGVLALAIVWVNTLLVAAAALKDALALAARRRGMSVTEARVIRGDGRTGALAGHRVEQIGRAGQGTGAREAILFSDRAHGGEVYGGAVSAAGEQGGDRELRVAPVMEAEVWLPAAAVRAAAACPSAARFEEAYLHARKARGYSRTVEAMIRADARVWIVGERGPGEITPSLIAAMDPRAWCRSKERLLAAFAIAVIAAAAGCTAVALVPPAFGTVSKIGGALCLGFFLLVQPAGTAVRDAVRVPSRAILRGQWSRRALGA